MSSASPLPQASLPLIGTTEHCRPNRSARSGLRTTNPPTGQAPDKHRTDAEHQTQQRRAAGPSRRAKPSGLAIVSTFLQLSLSLPKVPLEQLARPPHSLRAQHYRPRLALRFEIYPATCSRSSASQSCGFPGPCSKLVYIERCQPQQRQHHLVHFSLVVIHPTPDSTHDGSIAATEPPLFTRKISQKTTAKKDACHYFQQVPLR